MPSCVNHFAQPGVVVCSGDGSGGLDDGSGWLGGGSGGPGGNVNSDSSIDSDSAGSFGAGSGGVGSGGDSVVKAPTALQAP